MEVDFWPYKVAKELVRMFDVEKQVISSGTSMSGEPHIGSANDVIRAQAIYLALKDMGVNAELNWISDNMDPLRSVPKGMPKELEKYLGFPVSSVPDFWGCHNSFAEHFESQFIEQLKEVFVEPVIYPGSEMYKKGMYNETIKIAFEKRMEIKAILDQFRQTPLPEDWFPFKVICENCGKIATTKILNYHPEDNTVDYICSKEPVLLHKKYFVRGCGYKGRVSVFNGSGKLIWRIEWPARWSFLKVTCEPFGKEHAASGGSYDTGKEIVEKIFGWKAPYPVIYEHFLVNGEKMSKSKGNVITLPMILRYMAPEELRYWMFQGKLTIAKDIRIRNMVPHTMEEFDKAEKIFFGKIDIKDERRKNNYIKAYKLAIVKVPEKLPIRVPFRIAVQVVQLFDVEKEFDKALEFIKISMGLEETPKEDIELIKQRLWRVNNWVRDYLEMEEKIRIKSVEEVKKLLKEEEMEILRVIGEEMERGLNVIEAIAKASEEFGKNKKDIFQLCYLSIFGKKSGPKLLTIEKIWGRKFLINRFKMVG